MLVYEQYMVTIITILLMWYIWLLLNIAYILLHSFLVEFLSKNTKLSWVALVSSWTTEDSVPRMSWTFCVSCMHNKMGLNPEAVLFFVM